MKSQIWRLAGVSVLSLAMFGSAWADDDRDARSVMGGGSSQREQGRGNAGGNQGGGNQGGHQGGNQGGNQGGGNQQSRPQQQPGPQGAARTLGGSNSSQRDNQNQGRPGNQGGYGNGYNGGYNGGGYNQGGYGQGQGHNGNYNNGYGGGYNGGRNDRDDDRGHSSNNEPRGPQGPARELGAKSPKPQDNQWQGGRPGGGWGPGPRWQPGYRVDTIPTGRWRVPHGGIDYYYADGYWYRPYGPSYVVVTPPYGVRVRTLPSYAEQLWIGSSLYFLAAGTYYLYEANRQEYVVASPPAQVTSNNGWQGNGYDVVAYPARGQSAQIDPQKLQNTIGADGKVDNERLQTLIKEETGRSLPLDDPRLIQHKGSVQQLAAFGLQPAA